MPSIDINFLHQLKDNYKNYNCFIETGTYLGETITVMENLFEKLFTIEVDHKLYINAKQKYGNTKINFLLGDSSNIFKTLLPTIKDNTIFFLDGHYSSGITGKGNKDCPLLEEINAIKNYYKNEAIIIIDDYRLFGSNINEDWSEISKQKIVDLLNDRIKDVYHLPSHITNEDRLIIHIK